VLKHELSHILMVSEEARAIMHHAVWNTDWMERHIPPLYFFKLHFSAGLKQSSVSQVKFWWMWIAIKVVGQ